MIKYILPLILLIIFGCTTAKNQPVKIPIEYDNEAKELGSNIFFVPIQIKGINKSFKMQFDLGLDVSAIYGNSLNSIIRRYPNINHNHFTRKDYEILKINYQISKYKSELDSLFIINDYGSKLDFEEQDLIGSIGVNQFKNKILLLNYSEDFIQIFDNDNQLDKTKFDLSSMDITSNNKILIHLDINNQETKFLFDTGNGVPLFTINKRFYNLLTENHKESHDTINGSSWGQPIILIGDKQQVEIGTENIKLEKKDYKIYYTESDRIRNALKEVDVEHSIGNQYFLDKTILFDFINNEFGILK